MRLIVLLALTAVAAGAINGTQPSAASAPTRLVHKPLAFRLTGYQDAPSTSSLVDYRYAVVFKLNRDPRTVQPANRDDQNAPEGTPVPTSGGTTRGHYYLRGYELQVSTLYAKKTARAGTRNCFVGYLDNGNASFLRRYARVPLGARTRVTLHPTKYNADGSVGYDKLFSTLATLRQADVGLGSKATKKILRGIGC